MKTPSSMSEENVFTASANRWIDEREKVFRVFMWSAIIFCALCFLLCWYGVSTFAEWNRNQSYYIAHEIAMSERREQRELEKAKRDSIMASQYFQQVEDYKKLPNYKGK